MKTLLEELITYRTVLTESNEYQKWISTFNKLNDPLSPKLDKVEKLLNLLDRYAEKMNQLSQLGKSTDRYQKVMDRIEAEVLKYPDGKKRLNAFWSDYNNSFDPDYENMNELIDNLNYIVYHDDWLVNVYFSNGHLWIWNTEMWSTHGDDHNWGPTVTNAVVLSIENEKEGRGGFVQLMPNIKDKATLIDAVNEWCGSVTSNDEFQAAIHTAVL
jgi:hypothetical protein